MQSRRSESYKSNSFAPTRSIATETTSVLTVSAYSSKRPAQMEMIRVNSTAITAIGYDPHTRHLAITFQQGHTYDFCNVPRHIYEGLLAATSKGTYYNRHIRDTYPC